MKRFPAVLLILCFAFLSINVLTLKEGHNWGGDFSQYINHAKNIIEHKPYGWSYELEPKIISPPGFPLLLAPVIKFFGINFKVLKFLNIIFWLGFVFCFYRLAQRYLGEQNSSLAAAGLLFSPGFFCFKQNVLSDLPFLFFTMAALYLWVEYFEYQEEHSAQKQNTLLFQALLFTSYGFLIRWAGIFLFLSVIFFILIRQKDRRVLLLTVVALAGSVIAQSCFGSSWAYHLREQSVPFLTAMTAIFYNIPQTLKAILINVFPLKTALTTTLFGWLLPTVIVLAPVILVTFLFNFLRAAWLRRLDFLSCFTFIYLFFSLGRYVMGGQTRYLLPLWGPVLILGGCGLIKLCGFLGRKIYKDIANYGNNILTIVLLLMFFYNVGGTAMVFSFNDDDIYQPEVREMTTWIKNNTAPDAVVMFREPRVLGLLTQRRGISFLNYFEPFNLNERLHRFAVQYVVFEKMSTRLQDPRFNSEMLSFRQLSINETQSTVEGTENLIATIDPRRFVLKDIWSNQKYRIVKVEERAYE